MKHSHHLQRGFEVLMSNLSLFVPFIVGASLSVVIALIAVITRDIESTVFRIGALSLLGLAALIVVFITSNWGFYLINTVVRTKRLELLPSFEASLPYLIRFVSFVVLFIMIILVGYVLTIVTLTINHILAGAVGVAFSLFFIYLVLKFSLAKEAIYYENASLKKAFKISKRMLGKNLHEYCVIVFGIIAALLALLIISYVAKYVGPFAHFTVGPFQGLVLLSGLFLLGVWKHVVLSVFYRSCKLGR